MTKIINKLSTLIFLVLVLAINSFAESITVSGSVVPASNLFSFRQIYVKLHNIYTPEPDRFFAMPPLWRAFWFTDVRPGERYSVTPISKGVVFEPAVVFLDEPVDNVQGIVFVYGGGK